MKFSPSLVTERLLAPDLPETLSLLGCTAEDARDMLVLRDRVVQDPAAIERITDLADTVTARIGDLTSTHSDPVWVLDEDRPGEPQNALATLLVTVPEVRAFHRSRGISDAISWRSLADLGQQVSVHRLTFGEFGVHTHGWLLAAWSGGLYRLGRLQYTFHEADGYVYASAHIPRTGALSPADVDASFARVAPFFAAHFPDYPLAGLHCNSWLLDPHLQEVLPGHSNISAFGARWELTGVSSPGNDDVIFFVFARRGEPDLATLPTETRLQRAALEHIRDGGQWRTCEGRLPVPPVHSSSEDTPCAPQRDLARPGAEVPEALVREFHRVYDVPVGATPSLDSDRVTMRMALIAEEFTELVTAIYGQAAGKILTRAFERAATFGDGSRDVVEAADALGDLIYVLYGMALECGIPLTLVLAEIQASNLSKLGADGRPILRSDGKIMKGPDYVRPDIAAVLGVATSNRFQ